MKEHDIEPDARTVRVRFGKPPEPDGRASAEKTMTTKELVDALGCTIMTIFNNAKICLPNKKIENGGQTLWTEREVTVLLEYMKRNNNNQHDLIRSLEGVETAQSLELEAALAVQRAIELQQKVIMKLKAENDAKRKRLAWKPVYKVWKRANHGLCRLAILAEKRLELEKQFNAELRAEIAVAEERSFSNSLFL